MFLSISIGVPTIRPDPSATSYPILPRSRRKIPAPRSAATGRVVTQATRMLVMVPHFVCLVTVPMPNREPQETWVVETGRPNFEAKITRKPVTKLC